MRPVWWKDAVCVAPLIRRQVLLVGECYTHGLMEGQAMNMTESGELVEETFNLC